jgi:type IV fimbrial biogenesis protein FimT
MKKHSFTVFKRELKQAASAGFTLVELMVVVALVAIVSAIAVPNFTEMVQRNNITSHMNEFIGAMNYARNQAITRGTYVTVCRTYNDSASNNQVNCRSSSYQGRDSDDWGSGWLVLVEDSSDAAATFGFKDTDELVLKRYPSLASNYHIRKNGASTQYYTFNAQGQLPIIQAASNMVFSGGINSLNKTMCIASSGRFRTLSDNLSDCNAQNQ